MSKSKKKLSADESQKLIQTLKTRFEKNAKRHPGIDWKKVQTRIDGHPDKLWSLNQMEQSGGEPDVVEVDKKSGEIIFFDCSSETPKERRSICYDQQALDERKEHKPADSAINMAQEMGIEMLNEQEYRYLQTLGEFDTKTSSWIVTPAEIRKLGGALFADRRYNHVFVYHNGASSYYGVRGFRGSLKI